MLRFLRHTAVLLTTLCLGALLAVPSPASGYSPDAEYDCDGGFYSLISYAPVGGQLVRCLGDPGGYRAWTRDVLSADPRVTEGADGITTAVTVTVAKGGYNTTPLPIRVRSVGGTATRGSTTRRSTSRRSSRSTRTARRSR